MTHVVVGEAVIVDAPVSVVPKLAHRWVTFLNHPLPCSSSNNPNGLVGTGMPPMAVGFSVRALFE